MYKSSAGALQTDSTRSGGKVIDEWRFISPFRTKEAPKLTAKISIHKPGSKEFYFSASSDSLPNDLTDTDINRLRQKVDDALRHQHDMLTSVTWVDWLEVVVRGRRFESDALRSVESDLHITYTLLKRGVHPETKRAYVINGNGIAVPFPSAKKAGELDPDVPHEKSERLQGAGILGLGPGREFEYEYSYLPATPENITGLNELVGRLQVLRASLSSFLRQDAVGDSLASLAGTIPALPAPL